MSKLLKERMKYNTGGKQNPITDLDALTRVIRNNVYTTIYVIKELHITARQQFEADTRRIIILRKE